MLLPLAVALLRLPILRVLVLTSARASAWARLMVLVAQLMVHVQVQMPMLALLLVQAPGLLVLLQIGGGSGNPRGPMKPMRKFGMQTVRRWLRWKLARTGRVALTLRMLTLSGVL